MVLLYDKDPPTTALAAGSTWHTGSFLFWVASDSSSCAVFLFVSALVFPDGHGDLGIADYNVSSHWTPEWDPCLPQKEAAVWLEGL